MVIEAFRSKDARAIYLKARDQGRGMPEGLQTVHSWVSANLNCCFQVVIGDDVAKLQSWVAHWLGWPTGLGGPLAWVAHWSDLIQFEIIPVMSGKETSDLLLSNPS